VAGVGTWKTIIRKFWIHTLKAQWVLRQYVCVALVKEFEAGKLTAEEKWPLVHRWDDTLKETYVKRSFVQIQIILAKCRTCLPPTLGSPILTIKRSART
jgi:hypothetical protein